MPSQTHGRREAGTNLIEAALVMPLLIVLLMGVVDLGRAYHTYITMINAAREGGRYAVTHAADTAAIQARVINEAQLDGVDLSAATITVDNQGSGSPVYVTVRLTFPLILGSVLGRSSIPIEAGVAFRARLTEEAICVDWPTGRRGRISSNTPCCCPP